MPVLVLLLAGLAVYSAIEGDLSGALRFLFVFDATRMTPQVALEALGLRKFLDRRRPVHHDHVRSLCRNARRSAGGSVMTIVSDTAISS